ncbi:MAG: long-chain fatty acid--CoA ligase [Bacteroidales bacterium]|nr:long-chain fatty acid--CoA ligase [Bacteroidales bacterium]
MMSFDWFAKWSEYQADKIAVSEYESKRAWSYGQLNQLAAFLGSSLKEKYCIEKGDRIAILAENCLEYIALLALAQKTGCIIVPLNYRLTPREIDFLLSDSKPKIIIWEKKFSDKLNETKAFDTIAHKMPLEALAALCDDFLNSGSTVDYKAVQLSEDDPLFLIYTSGTTSFPKGSIYTYKMLFWNSINTQLRLDITSSDRSLSFAPPFHTGGWNVLLTPFLHHGAYTLLLKNFDAEIILDILEKENMTIFWAVPTMLKMMADSDKFNKVNLSRIRYVIVGGEAMPIPLIEIWHKKGVPVRQGYGLTEVGPNVTSLNHQDAIRKKGSIGKPNFYFQVKLVDEKGNETPRGVPGECVIKSPSVTPGYWGNEEASRQTIIDGWFHTGDIMVCDDEGYLFVVDRIKNMYISGAENVYPAEIEYLLRQHPSVDAVAIIGVPDPKWGEVGKAFIVKKKNTSLSGEELSEYCLKNLAKFKVPRYFVMLDEIPKNDAGKIDRKKLREL